MGPSAVARWRGAKSRPPYRGVSRSAVGLGHGSGSRPRPVPCPGRPSVTCPWPRGPGRSEVCAGLRAAPGRRAGGAVRRVESSARAVESSASRVERASRRVERESSRAREPARRCGRSVLRAGAAAGSWRAPCGCRRVPGCVVRAHRARGSGCVRGERGRDVGERVTGAVAVGAPRERVRWGGSGLEPRCDPGRSRRGLVSASAVGSTRGGAGR